MKRMCCGLCLWTGGENLGDCELGELWPGSCGFGWTPSSHLNIKRVFFVFLILLLEARDYMRVPRDIVYVCDFAPPPK